MVILLVLLMLSLFNFGGVMMLGGGVILVLVFGVSVLGGFLFFGLLCGVGDELELMDFDEWG